ncbi:hypothetical protein IFT84_18940 [Rhizobium sp. CFBP 8762]|uniref:hypothetical protein n=1 Tax=Rhizobium sp. CFBP 8762 TaxID=2775279 RepID=UPI0017822213|nr:hypothetical protein [Rhizobium sp. CFBP 8762]MBD8556590.1 hypothetical protein [Rhizobium sp. CFBP 8762]
MRTYLAIGSDEFAALKQEIWTERDRWSLYAAGTYNGPTSPPVGAKLVINETSLARIFDVDLWGSDPQHVLIRDFAADEIDFYKEIKTNGTHIMLCRHHNDNRIVALNSRGHFENRYRMHDMTPTSRIERRASTNSKLASYSVYAMPVGFMAHGFAWFIA